MQKATRSQTKDHNSRLVLKTIYDSSPVSRADIARYTHLTRPTVSALAAELIDSGLVSEIGQLLSSMLKRKGCQPLTIAQAPCFRLAPQSVL